jgi:small GTP-binding protein
MRKTKIAWLGGPRAGKTALVQRFVYGVFSEEYRPTFGVRIHRKEITIEDTQLDVLLWDTQGEDAPSSLRPSYLRGASAYVLVVDATRGETLIAARELQKRAERALGAAPFVLLVNKIDLLDAASVESVLQMGLAGYAARGWIVRAASAKTGRGVSDAVDGLLRALVRFILSSHGRT